MDTRLFWRAVIVQGLLVAVLFGVLALLLDEDFFDDYGLIVGPLAWIGCAFLTGQILKLPLDLVLLAAAAGGVAGFLVSLVTAHITGIVIAVAVFGAACGGYEAMDEGDADGSPPREPEPREPDESRAG